MTCFACGQHIRERAHHHQRPINPLVLVLAGMAALAAVVGIIIMNSGRARRESGAVQQQSADVSAGRGSGRDIDRRGKGTVVDEVNSLEGRFDSVRQKVVRGEASQAQAELISQINAEIARLHELAAAIVGRANPEDDNLVAQLRDGERAVRTLITDLSHTPD